MGGYTFVCDRISMLSLLTFLVLFLTLRYPLRKTLAIAAAVYLVTAPMELLQIAMAGSGRISVAVTTIETLLVQSTALLLSRYRDFRALFTGLSAAAYMLVGNMVGTGVYLATGRVLPAAAVQLLLHAATIATLYRYCRTDFLAEVGRRRSWGYFCLIPALMYVTVYALAVWPQRLYDKPENLLPILLVLLMMALSYILIFRLIGRMRRDAEYRRSAETLTASVAALKRQIETTRDNQMQLSILKHDLRHDNNILLGYLEKGEISELETRLKAMNTRLDGIVTAQYCANVPANSVLQANAKLAADSGVAFQCRAQLDEQLPVDEFELATVLSNLVENAVQAAAASGADRPAVQVTIRPVKGQLLIAVANPFAGEVLFGDDGLPQSAKGEGHGYGLRSVKFFADRTQSIFDCTAEDGVFTARLLVPMESHDPVAKQ